MSRTYLVTGGAGYIGSHTNVELLLAGHDVVVLDDLSNASIASIGRVEALARSDIVFVEGSTDDRALLDDVFANHPIDAVIHFAGKKAVGESNRIPAAYYRANVAGTLTLIEAMAAAEVRRLVFSSSATVYGEPQSVPIPETAPLSATNPYGRTKLMIEDMLRDIAATPGGPAWSIVLLRYFNPIGSHPSGEIGEDPQGEPNNLMPYVMQVAVGRRSHVSVFGNDYATPDGTGVRDYIHVVDLAQGHLAALSALDRLTGCVAYNLGTGQGNSVLEVLDTVRRVTGKEVPHRITPRRPGDVAESYADPSRANAELNWTATRTLEDCVRDAWRWQSRYPDGYRTNATGGV